nr:hypothetical protein [Kibdelosporangium sp. MJ126-NF4]
MTTVTTVGVRVNGLTHSRFTPAGTEPRTPALVLSASATSANPRSAAACALAPKRSNTVHDGQLFDR